MGHVRLGFTFPLQGVSSQPRFRTLFLACAKPPCVCACRPMHPRLPSYTVASQGRQAHTQLGDQISLTAWSYCSNIYSSEFCAADMIRICYEPRFFSRKRSSVTPGDVYLCEMVSCTWIQLLYDCCNVSLNVATQGVRTYC